MRVVIDGKMAMPEGMRYARRYVVKVDGQEILMRAQLFRVVALLGLARLTRDHGWICSDELEVSGPAGNKVIWRVRRYLSEAGVVDFIENDRQGSYRMTARPRINKKALQEFGDATINQMLSQL